MLHKTHKTQKTYGTKLNPSKCPLPSFRDPHLVRQVHLLRLDRTKLSYLSTKYAEKLSKSLLYFLTFYGQLVIDLPDKQETELLEFLEWYEKVLDLTHQLIEDVESVEFNFPLSDIELEALQLSFDIEKQEGDDFYNQLFDGVGEGKSITADIRTIFDNARKIDGY
jgi:hypothetical protein